MIIGITGPIASGKDILLNIMLKNLNKKNISIIDADIEGKELVQIYWKDIEKMYNVNSKQELSKLVFSNIENLKNYNNYIHPKLSSILKKKLLKFAGNQKNSNCHKFNNQKLLILNCALLHLFKLEFLCNKIIFIDSSPELRLQRLINRNNLCEESAKNIIKLQMLIENYTSIKKIKINDKKYSIIENNAGLTDFETSITETLDKISKNL
ncbi:MAG TPA: dephospho-CoA kinase [Exilispira sp.]|nr:dephospho-CoA kinase [Spirochaetota bacterium]HOV45842.1 dephospho-CoA kinase [Exilispira sp.]HPB47044.1 dephospho-CoA kinase [Exilispira sp.]HQM89117.1 dephospho-CoA kinase [Exilispira sp.]